MSAIYDDPAVNEIDTGSLPDSTRKVFEFYLERYNNYRSHIEYIKFNENNYISDSILKKKRSIERGIYSSINLPGIDSLAADFADWFPLYYEWEGLSEPVLAEADSIKSYLTRNPSSQIIPYLQILLLHRLRCGTETLLYENNLADYNKKLTEYNELLNLIYKQNNLLFSLIAEDLDRQEYLYVNPRYIKNSK